MEKIIVYSTGCPLCRALENILNKRNIEYDKISDVEYMRSLGFTHVPIVEIRKENNEVVRMNFKEAVNYFGGL